MKKNKLKFISITVLLLSIVSGCTSIDTIDKKLKPIDIVEMIDPGDEIIIHTNDNKKHVIIVDSISTEKITGSGKSFKHIDIVKIQKEDFDLVKSMGANLAFGTVLMYTVFTSL